MFRASMNSKQIRVYNQLLETIEGRKAPLLVKSQVNMQAYIKPQEVEREFLDAFSVILESGYFMAEEDFFELVAILDVKNQPVSVGDRIKIF